MPKRFSTARGREWRMVPTMLTTAFGGKNVGGQFELPAGGQLVGSYLAMRPIT